MGKNMLEMWASTLPTASFFLGPVFGERPHPLLGFALDSNL
jgi:hypothetical protein